MNRAWKNSLSAIVLVALSLVALLFHVAGGATIVDEYMAHSQPENLDFSFSYCADEAQPAQSESKILWDGDTAVINVLLSPNCGTSWIFGNYKVTQTNELVLGYKSVAPSILGCDCGYPATYRISGLEKKDYSLRLKEYAFINRTPWLVRSLMEVGPDIVREENF